MSDSDKKHLKNGLISWGLPFAIIGLAFGAAGTMGYIEGAKDVEHKHAKETHEALNEFKLKITEDERDMYKKLNEEKKDQKEGE